MHINSYIDIACSIFAMYIVRRN